jgi:dTDP-4-dehydrorhamnose reductase
MRILLFGSTGMLGNYVKSVFAKDHEVICVNRDSFDIEKDDWKKLEEIIKLSACEIIINCAGIIPQKESDPRKFIKVNTLFPHKMNEYSKLFAMKFIHVTTDCVFDGKKGNYAVDDEHTATDIYGISKSLGEPSEATVIRTSIIGEELCGKKSFIEWVKKNADKQINGYTNHYWNGVTCLTLANIIKEIVETDNYWKGVRHIHSPNAVSKYDMCCYVNEIYDLNIIVEKYEDANAKNMTLVGSLGICYIFEIEDVRSQILKQKEWNLNNMKNLVLITSVICTPNLPLSYTNMRSIYSHNDRFEQTQKTIETIKDKIPNAEIIMVECSEFTEDQNNYFKMNCKYFLNLINDLSMKYNVYGKSKSLGEGTMTICALDYIIKNDIQYDNLIKISGRYWLSDKFNYNNFYNNDIVIKYINGNVNNGFTALYKMPKNKVNEYLKFLIENVPSMQACIGYEVLFANYLKTQTVVTVDPIGLAGHVSVSNDYYDG